MKESKLGWVARRGTLAVLGLVWLIPVYLLLVNAFKSTDAYDADKIWVPDKSFGLFANLRDAWDTVGLGQSIGSTALYSVTGPALAVVIGAMAGYAIVVLRLRAGFWWFLLLFGGTVFPTQMLLIPLFLGYSWADLYDRRVGLVLIYTAVSIPLAAFVMRNFFTGIAYEMFEAARVEGASTWHIFRKIYFPLALPALGAVFILEFAFIWNDLLFGLTLSQSDPVRPVMTALSALSSAYAGSSVPVLLAAGLVMSLPTVAVFLAAQRMFARGLALGQF
ncbi:carbohydrate ABC transporter membrane protein 2 (CUT1 family) [Asanoa ferruginea]|uniref:Carbohydrate ABC transporter membrane protein 2 (CUT1 family) n=1 Tax=Asanoa ferruginea TaxID=53367 RepID=A0A3D9ZBD1_9ACTN|nr:carbohydrate ABC transporter permease [Asanoa ferruginea]REF94708.1 carbohydrate ABC transporter membrane protein 2 (CUT1 family) [Asanoa ferruginea]GIF45714.1 permease [Asanoa ferruginea]